MAFSYGFFNAKNLDRVYTAEDFTSYLSSLICNGILDTYGDNFSVTANGNLSVVMGTGKAWIGGHYFINDMAYILDLRQYVDESLSRYVIIGISCDVSDSVRACKLEVKSGTAATSPSVPTFENTDTKTYLTLASVRLNGGITSISQSNIKDYRSDENKCGYVKCILGKCRVSEMLLKMEQIDTLLATYNKQISDLQYTVDLLQTKVDDLTGDITETGQCGEDIYYVLYSNGKLLLRGTGAMYDYDSDNHSPFRDNETIRNLVVSSGITHLGAFLEALNEMVGESDSYLKRLNENLEAALNMTNPMTAEALAAKMAALQQELINRTERRENYDDITEEILRLRELQEQKGMDDATQKEHTKRIRELQKFIQSQPSEITEFDESLVKKLLEKVTVHDDYLEFRFKSGVTISIEM